MSKMILICTVGGSPNPILTAIQSLSPDFVVFVCSGDDPATGAKGSYTMVTSNSDNTIPSQAGLQPEVFEALSVLADDFTPTFRAISDALDRLTSENPDATIVADVTGGTKTMTAALMLAAIDRPNIRLQLVTGVRDNLQKVRDGSQYVVPQDVAAVRIKRAMQPFILAWIHFAYDEAADGFDRLLTAAPPIMRPEVQRLRDLSRGFAAWDRFDHTAAKNILSTYSPMIGKWLHPWLMPLGSLSSDELSRREPLILHDLWRNAERRAARGRYDDAVGRCYRLIEWTAQWLWRVRHETATDDFPAERIPDDLKGEIQPNRKGKYSLGLYASWQLLMRTEPDTPAGAFFKDQSKILLNHLERRNSSLLAHGFAPIGESDWLNIKKWTETRFLPMLKAETTRTGRPAEVPQLPGAPPA